MSTSTARAEHEDIEKKMAIFHIFNGALAKARNLISYKKILPGHMVDS